VVALSVATQALEFLALTGEGEEGEQLFYEQMRLIIS
jgi:hypothetical protein